jgi:phosphoglycolate phosphatase
LTYDLIIFDLDGTLVDTLPDIAASLNHTLIAAKFAPLPDDTIRSLVGEGMRRLVEKALAAQPNGQRSTDESTIQALVDGHNRYYADHVCVHSRPYEGVMELLATLKRNPALRLAVLSNKPGKLVRSLLAALDLASFIDIALGDYDGFPTKPDASAARSILHRFAIGAEKTLVVGDGVPDLQLAQALGCASAAALWGFTPVEELRAQNPTFILDKALDVLRLGATNESAQSRL